HQLFLIFRRELRPVEGERAARTRRAQPPLPATTRAQVRGEASKFQVSGSRKRLPEHRIPKPGNGYFGTSISSLTGGSGNHPALKHLVSNGTGDTIEKLRAHLRILAQHFHHPLLHHFSFSRWRLAFLLG